MRPLFRAPSTRRPRVARNAVPLLIPAGLLALGALLATTTASAQVRDTSKLDPLPDTDPGFKSPGYAKHYPGMALVRRGELTVRVRARLEARVGLYASGQDTQGNMFVNGDHIERMGFGIPRARIGLGGQLANHIPFVIVSDLARGGGDTTGKYLLDAWIGYERFHYFKFYLGARTVPFTRSAILSSADAGLAERSRASDSMAPFRQVGLTVAGDYKLLGLGWRAGVYNGFERHPEFYGGHVNAVGLRGNRFHGMSWVGRLHLEPLGKMDVNIADFDGGGLRIHVGGGAYGNDAGSYSTMGIAADLHIKVAGLHAFFEFITDTANPSETPTTTTTIPANVDRQAITAEVGYTMGKNGFALRTELIDPNKDKDDNRDEMWLSACYNHYFLGNMARFSLQFDHRQELNGEPRDNDALHGKLALRF